MFKLKLSCQGKDTSSDSKLHICVLSHNQDHCFFFKCFRKDIMSLTNCFFYFFSMCFSSSFLQVPQQFFKSHVKNFSNGKCVCTIVLLAPAMFRIVFNNYYLKKWKRLFTIHQQRWEKSPVWLGILGSMHIALLHVWSINGRTNAIFTAHCAAK